jgi:hypothetical protein
MTVTGINGIGVDISVKNDNGTPSFVGGESKYLLCSYGGRI